MIAKVEKKSRQEEKIERCNEVKRQYISVTELGLIGKWP